MKINSKVCRKVNSEEGDGHADGMKCLLIAHLDTSELDKLKTGEDDDGINEIINDPKNLICFVLYENEILPIGTIKYKLEETDETKEITLSVEQLIYMKEMEQFLPIKYLNNDGN
jgi:hypothetical protein